MKPPPTRAPGGAGAPSPRPSRTPAVLWTLALGSLVAVAGYWFYLGSVSRLSEADVRAEGETVAAILKAYKSAHGHYPRALTETRVADTKFPRGLAVGYTPNADLSEHILVVSGGGHTWRYHSGAAVWQLVPAGDPVGGVE